MRRMVTITTIAVVALAALGTALRFKASAEHYVPYWKADVNSSGAVTLGDVSAALAEVGHAAPTPEPTPLRTYFESVQQSSFFAKAYCDAGDAVTGGGFAANGAVIRNSQPEGQVSGSDPGNVGGWLAQIDPPGVVTAIVMCVDNPPYRQYPGP